MIIEMERIFVLLAFCLHVNENPMQFSVTKEKEKQILMD
jgi:hypothetical protein